MSKRGFTVRALGEIAIRCVDFEAMVAFYRDVIGLVPMRDPTNAAIAFFRIGEGYAGHTAVLALFRHDVEGAGRTRAGDQPPATGPGSSLHHIALSLPWAEHEAVMAWYEELGLEYHVEAFDWVGWRGVFTFDPDGNTVELVAKDPDWIDPISTLTTAQTSLGGEFPLSALRDECCDT
jgi:catechol 2,3-dioxygenase-like lactoylglutathione lyase family enzyme